MPPREKKVASGKQATLNGFFSKLGQQTPQSSRVPPPGKAATPKVKKSNGDAAESDSVPSSASKIASSQSTTDGADDKTPATTPVALSSPISIDEEDDGVEVVLTTVCL